MRMISVRFTKPWQGYNTGEVAGFLPHQARRLVNDFAVADYVDAPMPRPTRVPADDGAAAVGGYDQMGWDELRAVYKAKFGRMPRSRSAALAGLMG